MRSSVTLPDQQPAAARFTVCARVSRLPWQCTAPLLRSVWHPRASVPRPSSIPSTATFTEETTMNTTKTSDTPLDDVTLAALLELGCIDDLDARVGNCSGRAAP